MARTRPHPREAVGKPRRRAAEQPRPGKPNEGTGRAEVVARTAIRQASPSNSQRGPRSDRAAGQVRDHRVRDPGPTASRVEAAESARAEPTPESAADDGEGALPPAIRNPDSARRVGIPETPDQSSAIRGGARPQRPRPLAQAAAPAAGARCPAGSEDRRHETPGAGRGRTGSGVAERGEGPPTRRRIRRKPRSDARRRSGRTIANPRPAWRRTSGDSSRSSPEAADGGMWSRRATRIRAGWAGSWTPLVGWASSTSYGATCPAARDWRRMSCRPTRETRPEWWTLRATSYGSWRDLARGVREGIPLHGFPSDALLGRRFRRGAELHPLGHTSSGRTRAAAWWRWRPSCTGSTLIDVAARSAAMGPRTPARRRTLKDDPLDLPPTIERRTDFLNARKKGGLEDRVVYERETIGAIRSPVRWRRCSSRICCRTRGEVGRLILSGGEALRTGGRS